MRLNRYLALCGVASRRQADRLIADGCITINGEVVQEMGIQVEPGDIVTAKGEPVEAPQQYSAWILNKPPGYLCTREDPQGRSTVYDLLPRKLQSVPYAGRLDLQSRGLLIFSNDGDLIHRLTHPSGEVPRCYAVWLHRELTTEEVQKIEKGLKLDDGTNLLPAKVKKKGKLTEITLREGKNREIRRMMETLEVEIRDLKRFAFAGLTLEGLKKGEYRELTQAELGDLYRQTGLASN